MWISQNLFLCFSKVFHVFYWKKDINLVFLHQNSRMWIKYITCLS